jgi:cytochrome bd-type quinol oxidase subunit 2
VRFEVVLPPTAPLAPVFPRRTPLLTFIWLVAMGVAAGVAYLITLFKPIVSSVRNVNELTAFPVLGVVGVAFPTRERRDVRRHVWRFSVATAGLFAIFATALILNWMGARLTIHAIRALVKT